MVRKKGKAKQRFSTGKFILFVIATMILIGLILFFLFKFQAPINYNYYQDLAQENSHYLLENQDIIMGEVRREGDRPENLGHIFIPESPATYIDIDHIPQYDVPYINQNDPRWAQENYGTDSSRKMWENGCAIASLAMVDQYFRNNQTRPQDIIAWSGNDYYIHEQGSAWSIFPAFGQRYGYDVHNLENDFHQAMNYLDQGYLIIVAVGPGTFTSWGHIMVIRGFDGYNVYLNDPNDSPEHFFSIQGIPADILVQEGLNYWAMRPSSMY